MPRLAGSGDAVEEAGPVYEPWPGFAIPKRRAVVQHVVADDALAEAKPAAEDRALRVGQQRFQAGARRAGGRTSTPPSRLAGMVMASGCVSAAM